MRRPALVAVGIVAAVLFAATVWPTPYRYLPAGDLDGGPTTARVNRFTGETWMIFDGAWLYVGAPAWPTEPAPGTDV